MKIFKKMLVIIFLLCFIGIPIIICINKLRIVNTYEKVSAKVCDIEKKSHRSRKNTIEDIYNVKILYEYNGKNSENVISNVNRKFNGFLKIREYDSYFKRLKENDEIEVYVNPNDVNEVKYIPVIMSKVNCIIFIIGVISLILLINKKVNKEV